MQVIHKEREYIARWCENWIQSSRSRDCLIVRIELARIGLIGIRILEIILVWIKATGKMRPNPICVSQTNELPTDGS